MEQRFTSLQPTADLPQLLAILRAREPEEGAREGRGWYAIKNISAKETEILIFDEIGFMGVTASDFVNELAEVRADIISLRINSPGGDVFDGIAIFNALKRHEATVNVFIDGIAASAASFIAMAGDSVTMMPHSQMMIHEAHGLVIGAANDMRKMADILDKSSDNIAGIYAERAGGTVPEWRARMQDESWFNDHEAVELGLADRIEGQEEEIEDRKHKEPKAHLKEIVLFDTDAVGETVTTTTEDGESEPLISPDFAKVFKDIADREEEAQYVGS